MLMWKKGKGIGKGKEIGKGKGLRLSGRKFLKTVPKFVRKFWAGFGSCFATAAAFVGAEKVANWIDEKQEEVGYGVTIGLTVACIVAAVKVNWTITCRLAIDYISLFH
jgi:hypothetical protein